MRLIRPSACLGDLFSYEERLSVEIPYKLEQSSALLHKIKSLHQKIFLHSTPGNRWLVRNLENSDLTYFDEDYHWAAEHNSHQVFSASLESRARDQQ